MAGLTPICRSPVRRVQHLDESGGHRRVRVEKRTRTGPPQCALVACGMGPEPSPARGFAPDVPRVSSAIRGWLRHAAKRGRGTRLHPAFGAAAVALTALAVAALFIAGSAPPATPRVPTALRHTRAALEESLRAPGATDAVAAELRRGFDIPLALSEILPQSSRYALLTRLQSASRAESQGPRLLMLHVVGKSPAGRLDAVATAMSYARLTDRFLVILWDTAQSRGAFDPDSLLTRVAVATAPVSNMYAGSSVESVAATAPDAAGTGASAQLVNAPLFVPVNGLYLKPSDVDWAEFHFSYFTELADAGSNRLDFVASLKSRHIFLRSQSALLGKYSPMGSGVMDLAACFTAGPSMRRSFYSFIKPWTFPHLNDGAVSDILHRVYTVPWVFLGAMSDRVRRKLLRALDHSTSKRVFFVHAQYGLGNRLRALGSAMAVSKVTGRVLVLIWEPDVHLNCTFNDLFANDLIVMEKLDMDWPPTAMHSNDRALASVDFFNFMRHLGAHVHNPNKVTVNPRSGRHVYVKTAYVVRSVFTPRIISSTSAYWRTMRETLVPVPEVMDWVQDPGLQDISNMIGVHIRSRTIENDIKGVSEEFYGDGSRTTDYWRRLTGIATFEKKLARLNPKYRFFVAADMRESIRALETRFGSHRVFSIRRDDDCVTRDVECAKLALADILLLSRVRILLGSNWSSFTEGAVRISGKLKILLAGVHFGRAPSPASKNKS